MAPDIRFPNIGIELQRVGTGVNLFGFEIAYYGIIIACGMMIGVMVAEWQAKRLGQNKEICLDFGIWGIVFAIIGARLYYVIFEWDYYKNNLLQIFNLRAGGLAVLGGVIAAVITAVVYCRIKKTSIWTLLDIGAPGLVMGQVIGRWGNFFNREVFGGYTDGLFAMQLKKSQVDPVNVTEDLLGRLVEYNGEAYIQVHPTFLYESLWNLGLFLLIVVLTKHKKVDGELFLLYMFGYGIGRAWIEGIRTDQLLIWGTNVPASQLLSAVMVLAAVVLFVVRRKYKVRSNPSVS